MGKLVACPFCREMFGAGEAQVCPSCGLPLAPVAKLPASYEAQLETEWPEKPEWEPLPWTYWRRGRAALTGFALAGAVAFFLPWIHQTAPDLVTLSGFDIARRVGWIWACLVSWGMLLPTVLSRRSVATMRGARAATGLFVGIPAVSALVLLLRPPRPPANIHFPFAIHFGLGLYATLALAIVALPFAVRFGGRLDDLPVTRMAARQNGSRLN
jgi:hypothetical protein